MATIEDMASVVNNVYHNSGEMADRILKRSSRRFPSIVMDLLYQALRDAENEGRCYNDFYKRKYCTSWRVGDYIIIYPSGYIDFNADMLTDDMMYDLIIEAI